MKNMPVVLVALLLAGCGARADSDAITHGMKWSIAQRELEQNGWTTTVTKSRVLTQPVGNGGSAYRYVNPKLGTVDVLTEQVGEIEKIYRIFDGDGKEIDSLEYKAASPR